MKKTKIAVFASGTGSNVEELVKQSAALNFEVALIVSNKKTAPVLAFAKKHNIKTLLLHKTSFYSKKEETLFPFHQYNIEVVVLAGFLWLIPTFIIDAFPDKIINIHPSLLPKYGGKGMYGMHVHQAVFENQEKESGITIHLVSEEYDKGKVLLQEKADISMCNSPKEIAEKVLEIEHKNYAKTIANYIAKLVD
ncbi:MAG: phosphoribosylglycinamide formyltransferase [Chitinophagales bacterium]